MSLIDIVRAVADTTSGPRPAIIIGNANPEAQSYLRAVTKVGIKLMKIYPWNALRQEYSFTAGGTETLIASASMPSDFDRFIPETFWDRSSSVLISGPISASRWQSLKASNYIGDNHVFTYRRGDVLTVPIVGSGSSVVFEYITNQYIESSGGNPQTTWQADTDVSLIDEELLALAATYEWLSAQDLPADKAFADFKMYFDMLQDNEKACENILVTADIFSRDSRHWTGTPVASRTVGIDYGA